MTKQLQELVNVYVSSLKEENVWLTEAYLPLLLEVCNDLPSLRRFVKANDKLGFNEYVISNNEYVVARELLELNGESYPFS